MASTDSATPQKTGSTRCSNCEKTGIALKRCAKCKTAVYCNRECQTAHWRSHKTECSKLASLDNPAPHDQGTSDRTAKRSNSKHFTAIHQGIFLHDRSEHETFKMLIDMIRMRQEDAYTFEGAQMTGTIYDQERSSAKALRSFLRRAEEVDGFLPPWWTKEKAEECISFGLDDANGSLLKCAQEKSDIQEVWKDDRMPMKLRMLGEGVYGDWPGVALGSRESLLVAMSHMEGA